MNYHWNWGIFWQISPDGAHTYFQLLLLGTWWTLTTAFFAWIIALTLGSLVGVARTTPNKWLIRFGNAYVELFRNIPLLVQMFLWYFVLPEVVPREYRHLAQAASRRFFLYRRGGARALHLGTRGRAGTRGHQ